jgi:hypothetical protein
MADATDHDLLIRIDERLTELGRRMSRHLAHHWTVTVAVLGALLAGVGSLLISLWGSH